MAQMNLASDKRRPGTFHTFDDTSGARGLVAIDRSTVLVGIKSSAGTQAVHTPVQVFSEAEADTYFGVGSELSLMIRRSFKTQRKLGSSVNVWACAVAAPAGVAATRTLTFVGTATANGDAVFKVAGRIVRSPVKVGDSVTTAAAAAVVAINAYAEPLPVTATSSVGVVTTLHRDIGVHGNDAAVSVVSVPAGFTLAAANVVAGTGVASLVTALDALGARDFLTVAVGNHLAQDVTDILSHMDAMWASAKKRWRHAFMAETGTLGTATTLASGSSRKELVIGAFEQSPTPASEIAAELATLALSKERPSYNYDGTELTIEVPPDSYVFLDSEVETAIAGGVTPLTVTDTGKAKLERIVTTEAGVEALRDFSVSATTAYYARQLEAKLAPAMRGKNADAAFLEVLTDIAYSVLKLGEALGDLHHVDDHAAEIKVLPHPTVPTRVLLEFPQSVVPNAHQVDVTHRLFVEGAI